RQADACRRLLPPLLPEPFRRRPPAGVSGKAHRARPAAWQRDQAGYQPAAPEPLRVYGAPIGLADLRRLLAALRQRSRRRALRREPRPWLYQRRLRRSAAPQSSRRREVLLVAGHKRRRAGAGVTPSAAA